MSGAGGAPAGGAGGAGPPACYVAVWGGGEAKRAFLSYFCGAEGEPVEGRDLDFAEVSDALVSGGRSLLLLNLPASAACDDELGRYLARVCHAHLLAGAGPGLERGLRAQIASCRGEGLLFRLEGATPSSRPGTPPEGAPRLSKAQLDPDARLPLAAQRGPPEPEAPARGSPKALRAPTNRTTALQVLRSIYQTLEEEGRLDREPGEPLPEIFAAQEGPGPEARRGCCR